MNLHRIREDFERFRAYLRRAEGEEGLFLYESQAHFQKNWDLDAENPRRMYAGCFRNSRTTRLWKREGFRPLDAMDRFWEFDASAVQDMFRDLFRESNAVDGRMGRFVFYCDDLLDRIRTENPGTKFNAHHHDRDYHMISLYLAFRYPEIYNLYRDDAFRLALQHYQAKPLATAAPDPERYFKVSRTLFKLMQKEEGLIEAHQQRLNRSRHYTDASLLLVYEFVCFRAGAPLTD